MSSAGGAADLGLYHHLPVFDRNMHCRVNFLDLNIRAEIGGGALMRGPASQDSSRHQNQHLLAYASA